MSTTNDTFATALADIFKRLADGVITEAQAEAEIATALNAFNPPGFSRPEVAKKVVQLLARLSNVLIADGVPDPNSGDVGGVALDVTNGRLYGPKAELDDWGTPLALASQNWNDLTNRPASLTDGRVAAGLTTDGDVARDVPDARITESSVTQHGAAMPVSTAQQTALDGKLAAVEGIVRQSVQTAAFTAVAGGRYPCNTAGGGFAVTLPAGADGDRIELYDPNGSWAFAFVEVIGPVLGYSTNPLCDVAGGFVTLTKHGALWVIHASPPTYSPYNLEDA